MKVNEKVEKRIAERIKVRVDVIAKVMLKVRSQLPLGLRSESSCKSGSRLAAELNSSIIPRFRLRLGSSKIQGSDQKFG